MSILEQTPTPRHRGIFPGELVISAGNPSGITIRLMNGDISQRTATAHGGGSCWLLGRSGAPLMIRAGDPAYEPRMATVSLDQLATFTGRGLGREILTHCTALLRGLHPHDSLRQRTVRFRDPAGYNRLITSLAASYFGVSVNDTLLALRADIGENYQPQLEWYQSHRPQRGESPAGYQAEVTAFTTVVADWLRTTPPWALAA
jgi:hypothetical protein